MDQETARALLGLYQATAEPDQWPTVLKTFAASIGAAGCILIPKDPALIEVGFPVSRGLEDVMSAFVEQGWHRHDIRADRGWPMFARGAKILVEDDLTTDAERRRSPYHQELFRPFGLPWWAGVGFQAEFGQWCMTIIRGAGQGRYERADVASLEEVAPHLQRVVELSIAMRKHTAAGMLLSAQTLHEAALLLDRQGKVIDASPAAQVLLREHFLMRAGRMVARSHTENTVLQAAIDAASTANSPLRQRLPGRAVVTRTDARPLFVDVYALPGTACDVFQRAITLVVLRTPGPDREKPARFASLFNLTQAEAKFLVAYYGRYDVRSAANALGIEYETARSHLKKIFLKSAVDNQAALAALIEQC